MTGLVYKYEYGNEIFPEMSINIFALDDDKYIYTYKLIFVQVGSCDYNLFTDIVENKQIILSSKISNDDNITYDEQTIMKRRTTTLILQTFYNFPPESLFIIINKNTP